MTSIALENCQKKKKKEEEEEEFSTQFPDGFGPTQVV